jgi:hypothetical protein
MGNVIADRVKDTSTTTGTGSLTLSGTPPTGFQAFSVAMAVGDTCYYCISGGAEWEVGVGTLSGTTTLTRDTVLASSNSNALVSLSAGTKDVFLTMPAAELYNLGQAIAITRGYALQ